jgi:hypothetical protein
MNGSTNGAVSPLRIYDARSAPYPGPTPQAEDDDRRGDTAIVIDNGIVRHVAILTM